nr:hypothetical protein [Bacillus licheniformis]
MNKIARKWARMSRKQQRENREYRGRRAGGHPVRLVCVHGLYHHFTLKGEAFHVGSTSKIGRIMEHREKPQGIDRGRKGRIKHLLGCKFKPLSKGGAPKKPIFTCDYDKG